MKFYTKFASSKKTTCRPFRQIVEYGCQGRAIIIGPNVQGKILITDQFMLSTKGESQGVPISNKFPLAVQKFVKTGWPPEQCLKNEAI